MARIRTDDTRATASLDGLAFGTDFLYRCAYFHECNGFNETVFLLYRTLKINASPYFNLAGNKRFFYHKTLPIS